MAMTEDSSAERCADHECCIRVPRVEAAPGLARLAGEWHLRWMPDDSAWFLVPPEGNVFEIRVARDADPVGELEVDGVLLESVRRVIEREALFPPC